MGPQARLLILHASAGYGHQKCAEALAEPARKRGLAAEVADALDGFPSFFKKTYVGLYLWMMHAAPFLWGFFFAVTNIGFLGGFYAFLRRLNNSLLGRRLEERIRSVNPDVIFSTHFLPAEVAARLKRRGVWRGRVVTVVTDFMAHAFWIQPATDRYLVAAEETRAGLIFRGVEPGRVNVTGIPVDGRFAAALPRETAASKHGLNPAQVTALVTSGGTGAGPVAAIVAKVMEDHPDLQLAVVCGKNNDLFTRLTVTASRHKRLKVFGFVDFMHELMDAADFLIGKAGGLTLSEALAKGRPFFILSPVPGQETANADLVARRGAGFWIRSLDDLHRRLHVFLSDPAVKKKAERAAAGLARPRAADEAVRLGVQTA